MNEHDDLAKRVAVLEEAIEKMTSANSIPIWLDQALQGAGYVKQTSVTKNKVLTYYVADASTTGVTHKIVITNGVLTTT